MEGLINGMIDVALGGHDGRKDDPVPQQRDERSRSTWAEVVSGEQDDEGRRQNEDGRRHHQSRWNKQDQSQGQSGLEGWEVAGSRPARRTQPVVEEGTERYGGSEQHNYVRPQGKKEDEEKNDDGWETVKKPPRKSHKIEMDHWHGYKQAASEQHYADEEVLTGGSTEPSEEELSDLSQACNKLWELDSNRLVAGRDYEIECGEGKKVYERDDVAEGSLFSWLGEEVLRRPTISRFCSLLDNYNPHQGCREEVTAEEKQEQLGFIEEISRTAPIKYLHKYLAAKGIVCHEYEEFKRMLRELWFNLYGRGGTSGCSSAFEHVFVGEIKQRGEQEVSGFHNWLQFYLEEAKGRVDYQGYIFPRRRGQTPDSETQVLTIQFEWNGVLKSVSSTLVGVSPEFEIALYTLCFFVGGEDNRIQLGPYAVNIKCYRLGDRIGSVFPIAE